MNRRQQGIVLIAMLAIIAMGAAWFTVRQLHAMSGDYTIANRNQNAAILARAKAALIGQVALQAAKAGEKDPGRFPCPEGPGSVGSALEGSTGTPCAPMAIGRFPWRTLGTEKFVDASGEPLWYVIATGWALGTTGTLVINPNCANDNTMPCNTGLLTVDAVKDTVALIIAPGPAMNVAASAGCTARNQLLTRTTPSPAIDPRDYIECYNTAAATFVTKGASASFNDQVVKITIAEIMPVIQAAIADRIAHEVAPLIKSAYNTTPLWPAAPVLPFAAPFGTPTNNPYNKFQGAIATQGLLPLSYAFTASPGSASACSPAPCTPTPCNVALDPRCDPAFVSWRASACGTPPCTTITRTGGANLDSYSCTVAGTPTTLTCTLNYYTSFLAPPTNMTFTLAAVANNAGMALRQLNDSVPINGVDLANIRPGPPAYGYCLLGSPGCTVGSSTINADGSATVNISAAIPPDAGTPLGINLLCGILSLIFNIPCYQHSQTITVPMALLSDHELVDPGNANPAGGIDHAWFFRNKWHELSYYAVAGGIAPSGARSCTTSVNCLRVSYHPNDGKQRGIIILGGAKIGNQLRPPTAAIMTPADLLEGANADGTSPFALRAPALITDRSFNDHLVVVDTN